MLYKFFLGINVIEDDICVSLVTCCEHDYLKMFVHQLEAFVRKWPNVETRFHNFTRHCCYVQVYVWATVRVFLSDTVCEGLVQIEDYCFFNTGFRERQIYHSFLNFGVADRWQILKEAD